MNAEVLAVSTFVWHEEVSLPEGLEPEALRRAVESRGTELGVDVTFRAIEADAL